MKQADLPSKNRYILAFFAVFAVLFPGKVYAQSFNPYCPDIDSQSDPLLNDIRQSIAALQQKRNSGEVVRVATFEAKDSNVQRRIEWALREAGIYWYVGGGRSRNFYVFKADRDAALKTLAADFRKQKYRADLGLMYDTTDAFSEFNPPYVRWRWDSQADVAAADQDDFVCIGAVNGSGQRVMAMVSYILLKADICNSIGGSLSYYIRVPKKDRFRALVLLEADANMRKYGIVLYKPRLDPPK